MHINHINKNLKVQIHDMDRFFKTIRDKEDKYFEGILDKENNSKFYSDCSFGIFCCCFLKHEKALENLLKEIQRLIKVPGFQKRFIHIRNTQIKEEKKSILDKIAFYKKKKLDNRFYLPQLERINERLKINNIKDYIDKKNEELIKFTDTLETYKNVYLSLNNTDGTEYIKENYYLFCIGEILFNEYKVRMTQKDFLKDKTHSNIVKLYSDKQIKIEEVDEQFHKYRLLSLNSDFQIFNTKDNQAIRDEKIGKYFWLDIPRIVLFGIQNLISNGLVVDVSFKISYISDILIALEAKDYGTTFSFNLLKLPEISKFYDLKNPDDNFWIKVDRYKKSITFEETLQDFKESNEIIITQVVHLEFYEENSSLYISHIDHEYIGYTMDEYAKRVEDSSIKGHIKVKTFKIDNSKIPLNYEVEGKLFLLLVLDGFFENKELLKEYFSQ